MATRKPKHAPKIVLKLPDPEQIQCLLDHVSEETIERYLGCKQWLRNGVNDRIGLEPTV